MRIDGTDATNVSISVKSSTNSGQNVPISSNSKSSTDEDVRLNLSEYEKRELPVSERVLIEAVERANKAVSTAGRTFEYRIHEKTKEIMIKVIDSETKEVIREIPPEKTLDMVAKMMEMAGLLVDERR